jgi:glutamine synthetase
MDKEDIIFVGVCDLAGHLRGKAFPAADLESRLRRGVGYTGSNIMMSAFGPIYDSPFGTEGDLALIPDPSTKVDVTFDGFAHERRSVPTSSNVDRHRGIPSPTMRTPSHRPLAGPALPPGNPARA